MKRLIPTLRLLLLAAVTMLASCVNPRPGNNNPNPDTMTLLVLLSDGSIWQAALDSANPAATQFSRISPTVAIGATRFITIDCDNLGRVSVVACDDNYRVWSGTVQNNQLSLTQITLPGTGTPQNFRDVACTVDLNGNRHIVATAQSAGRFEPVYALQRFDGTFVQNTWISVPNQAPPPSNQLLNFLNGISAVSDNGTIHLVGSDPDNGIFGADRTGATWSSFVATPGAPPLAVPPTGTTSPGTDVSLALAVAGGLNVFGQREGSIWCTQNGQPAQQLFNSAAGPKFTAIDAATGVNNLHLVGILNTGNQNGVLMHRSRPKNGTGWTAFTAVNVPVQFNNAMVDVAIAP